MITRMEPSNKNTNSVKNLVDLLESNLSLSRHLIEEASSKINQLILDLSSAVDEFVVNTTPFHESSSNDDIDKRLLSQSNNSENIQNTLDEQTVEEEGKC